MICAVPIGQNAAIRLAWDHALSLLSLYVSHGKRALFFPLSSERNKEAKKKNAWSQVSLAEEGLPTSDFRLPTSVAMKGGGRPARLLRYAKMLLVPKTFFFFLLLGRLCSRRFWLSPLFHIERSWHTCRFTVVFVSGRQDLPSYARACSLKLLLRPSKGSNFLQSAFWTWITMWLFLVREHAMLYHAGPSSLVFFAEC